MSDWLIILYGFLAWVFIMAVIVFLVNWTNPRSKLGKFRKVFYDRNLLFECTKCSRYFRQYQWNLYEDVNGVHRCPHCEKPLPTIGNANVGGEPVETVDKWMDTHPDCFKIGVFQYVSVRRLAKKLKQKKRDQEAIDRFLAYNQLKTDTNWVERLQDENKGE